MANTTTTKSKSIFEEIDGLAKRTLAMRDAVQHMLMKIVLHAVDHGDVTPGDYFIEKMKDTGIRRDAVVSWLTKHGCHRVEVTTNVDENGKTTHKSAFKLDHSSRDNIKATIKSIGLAAYATALKANPWQEAKKEAEPFDGFNLTAHLIKLVKMAERIQKDEAKANHPNTDLSILDKLRALTPVTVKVAA